MIGTVECSGKVNFVIFEQVLLSVFAKPHETCRYGTYVLVKGQDKIAKKIFKSKFKVLSYFSKYFM